MPIPRKTAIVAVLAGAAITVAATTATANAAPTQAQAATASAAAAQLATSSGEDLFQALFFGTGPVALAYPNLVRVQPQAGDEDVQAAATKTLAEMNAADPEFFSWFARGISSGDRVQILSTMEQVPDRVYQMFGPPGSGGVEDPGGVTGNCVYFAAVAVLVFFLGGNVAAFVNVTQVANVAQQTNYVVARMSDEQRRLMIDQWVDDIATDLGR